MLNSPVQGPLERLQREPKEKNQSRGLTTPGEKPKAWKRPLLITSTLKYISNTVLTAKRKKPQRVIQFVIWASQSRCKIVKIQQTLTLYYLETYRLLICDDITKAGSVKASSGASVSRFILQRIKKLKHSLSLFLYYCYTLSPGTC